MGPALYGRDPLLLHLVLADVHQTPRLVGAVGTVGHRQTAVPLGPQLLGLRKRRLRTHRVADAHLTVLRGGRRGRGRLRAVAEGLLQHGASDQGGAGAAITVEVGWTVPQRRTAVIRVLFVRLRGLGGRLVLRLPLLPYVLVGGEPQERDVDVEEAEVEEQAGGYGRQESQGGYDGEERGVARRQRGGVRRGGRIFRRQESLGGEEKCVQVGNCIWASVAQRK